MQRSMSYVPPAKRSLFPTSPPPIDEPTTVEEEEPKKEAVTKDDDKATATPEEPKKEAAVTPEKPKNAIAEFTTPEKPKNATAEFTTPDSYEKPNDGENAATVEEEPKHKKQKKMLHVFHEIRFKYASDVVKLCTTIKEAVRDLQKIDDDMADDAADAGMADDAADAGYNSRADHVASLFFEDIHNDDEKYAGAATYDQVKIMVNKVFRNAADVLIAEAAKAEVAAKCVGGGH